MCEVLVTILQNGILLITLPGKYFHQFPFPDKISSCKALVGSWSRHTEDLSSQIFYRFPSPKMLFFCSVNLLWTIQSCLGFHLLVGTGE